MSAVRTLSVEASGGVLYSGVGSSLRHHLLLGFTFNEEGRYGELALETMHFMGEGASLVAGRTGAISAWSRNGSGRLKRLSNGLLIESFVSGELLYRAIQEQREPQIVSADLLETPREEFECHIKIELGRFSVGLGGFQVLAADFRLRVVRPVLGWFDCVDLSLENGVAAERSLEDMRMTALQSPPRKLKIQPVGFGKGPDDPTRTAVSWEDQCKCAKELWDHDRLELVPLPIRYVDRDDLKESEEVGEILNSWHDQSDCRVIEVFFVRSKIPGGGGRTREAGKGLDNVVISDLNESNDYLLAHEIGHVLSGVHPEESLDGFWQADAATVLEPSNELGEPNPSFNTDHNRERAKNLAIDGAGCPRRDWLASAFEHRVSLQRNKRSVNGNGS